MSTSATVCANCGGPESGRINNIAFCSKPVCVHKVMAMAVAPIKAGLEQLR